MLRYDFNGKSLPALGLGCMRFPTNGARAINKGAVAEMIAYAMANGVNYFDTGYDYHGGMSETVIGEILASYPRESYFIADKFPGYAPANWRRVEEIFAEQLARLGVSYFDFYLLHNVSEFNIDAYLNPRYCILDYLFAQKEAGKIRHLGFSAHGSVETVERLLCESGKLFEFAQIQLNYIDYEFQHAKEKLALLSSHGIPVFVMEPLRGGRLAAPSAPFADRLRSLFPDMSMHEAAFRFVASNPSVALTLSGMSNMEQLRDNIAIFSRERTLTESERDALIAVAREMTAVGTIPCTACRYCTDHCPSELDIPRLIEYYNEHTFSGGGFIAPSAVAAMKRDARPTACIGCKSCESFCPQGIGIADVMKALCEKLNLKER